MEKIIDCKGMACPLPVVNAKKAAEELHSGDVLTVLVDNEIAVQNVTKMAVSEGGEVTSEKLAEKEYKVTIKIGDAVVEACKLANQQYDINFADYDTDKDGLY